MEILTLEQALRREANYGAAEEVEKLRRDAERYRWLCDNRDVLLLTGFFGNGCINRNIDEVHAAIDAARLKTPNLKLSGGA